MVVVRIITRKIEEQQIAIADLGGKLNGCLADAPLPRDAVANARLQQLAGILDLYRLDVGHYPVRLEALLTAPADAARWMGPYVRSHDTLIDPWGNLYEYRFPGEHGAYDLFSLGADRAEGGEGENQDVTSW